MRLHYTLDEGLSVPCQTGVGLDTVASLQNAVKALVKSKEVMACTAAQLEVYPLGINRKNFQDATPLLSTDKLPKGSTATNPIFVHAPHEVQELEPGQRYIQESKPRRLSMAVVPQEPHAPRPERRNSLPPVVSSKRSDLPDALKQRCYIKYGKQTFTVLMDPEEPWIHLKKSVEEATDVPTYGQKFYYNGINRPFQDDKSLQYYGIKAGGFFILEREYHPELSRPRQPIIVAQAPPLDLSRQKEKERLAKEQAEKDRLAEEARLKQLEEERLYAEAAQRAREAYEAAERERAAEAERKRKAAEEARLARQRKAEEDRLNAEAAQRAKEAYEEAEKERAAEAERKRKAAEEAKLARERKAEEVRLNAEAAERARKAYEEAEKQRAAEAERKRQAAEEAKLAKERKAEEERLYAEAAERARFAYEESERLRREEEAKKLAEMEWMRRVEEEKRKAEEEAKQKAQFQFEEEARRKAEAERQAKIDEARWARNKALEEVKDPDPSGVFDGMGLARGPVKQPAEDTDGSKISKSKRRSGKNEEEDVDAEGWKPSGLKYEFTPEPMDMSKLRCWYQLEGDIVPYYIRINGWEKGEELKQHILATRRSGRNAALLNGIEDASELKLIPPGEDEFTGKQLGPDDLLPEDTTESDPILVIVRESKGLGRTLMPIGKDVDQLLGP